MNKPKVIIFDFDRTLAYLYKDKTLLTDLAKKICEYYCKYVDIQEEYYAIDGYYAWYKLHSQICQKYNTKEAYKINKDAEKIVTDFEFKVMSTTDLFEGVAEIIKKLYINDYQLMIVSSNSSEVIKYALEKNKIITYFVHIVGRPNPFNPDLIKPNAYPIRKAISKTNACLGEIWYVGDDIVDIDSAKQNNIISIGIASGKYSCQELKQHGADYVLQNISDLLPFRDKCN